MPNGFGVAGGERWKKQLKTGERRERARREIPLLLHPQQRDVFVGHGPARQLLRLAESRSGRGGLILVRELDGLQLSTQRGVGCILQSTGKPKRSRVIAVGYHC